MGHASAEGGKQNQSCSSRRLRPELLDHLPANDPGAMRSRHDLQRINSWMRNATVLAQILNGMRFDHTPTSVADIGAGDGTLMLSVARRLRPRWPSVSLDLVDRRNVVHDKTTADFEALGWIVRPVQTDIFDWARHADAVEVIAANLFLHHFHDSALRELFQLVSDRTRVCVACEPRRLRFPRVAGWCVALIGGNAVSRHDAVLSVRAGFRKQELSALWPRSNQWRLEEGDAGPFSHFFYAQKSTDHRLHH